MEEVFKSFCVFGQKGAAPLMDGSKLAKMCRDCKLLDKHLTQTDVDIMFTKVKTKSERKINYKQFEQILQMLADKKYAGQEDGRLDKLKEKILTAKGPVTTGATKAVKSSAVDRLTDTTKYTGSHKERFDDSGKGKGKAGRDDAANATGYVAAYKEKGTYDTSH